MKKYFALFLAFLLIPLVGINIWSLTFAEQATFGEDLPSDLSLDLNLAEQNPAPDQKEIVASQERQADITTSTGETVTISPKDIIPEEIKTESRSDAVHPEETTSEQVVNTQVNVEEKTDTGSQNNSNLPSDNTSGISQEDSISPSPSNNQNQNLNSSGDVVPGTSVLEPNDNSAPPLLDNANSPQPRDTSPASSQPSDNTNTNSPDSGSSQDQSSGSTDNSSASDQNSVQGASTGPNISLWQKITNKFLRFFRGG